MGRHAHQYDHHRSLGWHADPAQPSLGRRVSADELETLFTSAWTRRLIPPSSSWAVAFLRGAPGYETLISAFKARGACVPILDADGDPLRCGIRALPYLIKPNEFEIAELVGERLRNLEEVHRRHRRAGWEGGGGGRGLPRRARRGRGRRGPHLARALAPRRAGERGGRRRLHGRRGLPRRLPVENRWMMRCGKHCRGCCGSHDPGNRYEPPQRDPPPAAPRAGGKSDPLRDRRACSGSGVGRARALAAVRLSQALPELRSERGPCPRTDSSRTIRRSLGSTSSRIRVPPGISRGSAYRRRLRRSASR